MKPTKRDIKWILEHSFLNALAFTALAGWVIFGSLALSGPPNKFLLATYMVAIIGICMFLYLIAGETLSFIVGHMPAEDDERREWICAAKWEAFKMVLLPIAIILLSLKAKIRAISRRKPWLHAITGL